MLFHFLQQKLVDLADIVEFADINRQPLPAQWRNGYLFHLPQESAGHGEHPGPAGAVLSRVHTRKAAQIAAQ